jgi:hypothetical protein
MPGAGAGTTVANRLRVKNKHLVDSAIVFPKLSGPDQAERQRLLSLRMLGNGREKPRRVSSSSSISKSRSFKHSWSAYLFSLKRLTMFSHRSPIPRG